MDDETSILDSLITTFGNNPYAWAHAVDCEEARPDLLKLLSRELRYGAHEPHVWRAACILVENGGEAMNDELDKRRVNQLRNALGLR